MMKIYWTYCWMLLIMLVKNTVAQELTSINYGVSSPLQTTTIYDLHVASDGLLFIATDNGLWSYNGLTFQQHQQQGLNTTDVTNIQEDSLGRIFFQNFKGQLFIWDGIHLQEDSVAQALDFRLKCFLIKGQYIYYWNEKNLTARNTTTHLTTNFTLDNLIYDKFLSAFTPKGLIKSITSNNQSIIYHLRQDSLVKIKQVPIKNYNSFLADYQDSWLILKQEAPHKSLLVNAKEEVVFDFSKTPIPLTPYKIIDWNNTPIIACVEGLYLPKTNQLYFKNKYISDVLEDQEGNIWVSTTTHGLHQIPTLNHVYYPTPKEENSRLDYCFKDSAHLLVNSLNSVLYYWNKAQKKFIPWYRSSSPSQIKNLFYTPILGKYIASNKSKRIIFDRNFNKEVIHRGSSIHLSKPNEWYSIYDNRLYYNTLDKLHFHIDGSQVLRKKSYPYFDYHVIGTPQQNCHKITLSNSTYITKHQQWILALRQDTLTYILDRQLDSVRNYLLPPNSQKIHLQQNRIWIELAHQLLEYDSAGHVLNTIPRINGLDQDISNLSINEQYLAISTKKAIYLYDALTCQYLHKFTTENGIASVDFERGWIYQDTLYINGSKGISSLPLDGKFHKGKPLLWIDNVLINASENKESTLDHDQNRLQLNFAIRSFTTKGNLYWRLNGKEWKLLEGKPQLELEELQYGDYDVEAYFENNLGVKTPIIQYAFEIKPPYWQTGWFYGLINLVLLGIGFAIWRQWLQNKRREEQRQNQFNLLKMQALQTQMNPHFIFNVQAAIQGLWLEGKEEAALELQTHFSKLLRDIFQYSGQQSISLEQLFIFLEHYIELEKIRFEDRIQLDWQIDPTLHQEDYFIPPLLVQPIIENAFKHGLLHKKGDKKLQLTFIGQEAYLYCKIADNGVGRKQASIDYKRASGLQTTQNRLELLQATQFKKQHPNNNLQVTDLKDPQNNSLGTCVELWIPFINFQKA